MSDGPRDVQGLLELGDAPTAGEVLARIRRESRDEVARPDPPGRGGDTTIPTCSPSCG